MVWKRAGDGVWKGGKGGKGNKGNYNPEKKEVKKKLEAEMEEMYDMPMIILKSCIMSIKQMLF